MAADTLEGKVKKPEILNWFNLEGELQGQMERNDFYNYIREEARTTGKITRKIMTVRSFIITSDGRIYIQKRSDLQERNAGLWDKSIGGHVKALVECEGKETVYDATLRYEGLEEWKLPTVNICQPEQFHNTAKMLPLDVAGVFKKLENDNNFLSLTYFSKEEKVIQPFMTTFYIGYYDGPIKMSKETDDVRLRSLDRLREEIAQSPDEYTEDLKYMINKFESELKSLK